MSTKTEATSADKNTLILWGVAIVVALLVIGVLGWQGFYGYVIPQAGKAATLPK